MIQLGNMPTWYYFARPKKMAFHDLTLPESQPPPNLCSLLGLGMKFIPNPSKTTAWSHIKTNTLRRLERDLKLKTFFAGEEMDTNKSFNKQMYVKSKWCPPEWEFPKQLPWRLNTLELRFCDLFKRKKGKPNLLPHQLRTLQNLQKQYEFIVILADKNLGPCVIELKRYIELAFRDHLSDTKTYKRIYPHELVGVEARIRRYVENWMKQYKKELTSDEKKYLKHKMSECTDFFPVFYLLAKVHKEPLKTRPVVSYSGSYLEALGKWIDSELKEVASSMPAYFKNSNDLIEELKALGKLPQSARLFTADAKSMYTNIPTDVAIQNLRDYLCQNRKKFPNVRINALIQALNIVMRNNVFQFGDTYWLQQIGTAMGAPPAPNYANGHYGIHEINFLPLWEASLCLYRRFLDDILGIWIGDYEHTTDCKFTEFKQVVNDKAYGLEWEFTELSKSVVFMDMVISIEEDGYITTTMYEKPTNLHLYIPPHSAHPPGLLTGIIHGTVHRIRTLCSKEHDQKKQLLSFFNNLRCRGYSPQQMIPIFRRALNVTKKDKPNESKKVSKLFLHVRYHPDQVQARDLQKAWSTCVAVPQWKAALETIRNKRGKTLGKQKLIVAYSRNPNLSNLLSYRRIDKFGTKVSSFTD